MLKVGARHRFLEQQNAPDSPADIFRARGNPFSSCKWAGEANTRNKKNGANAVAPFLIFVNVVERINSLLRLRRKCPTQGEASADGGMIIEEPFNPGFGVELGKILIG